MSDILGGLFIMTITSVACLTIAITDQYKLEKERRKRVLIETRERDYLYGFQAGMGYEKACAVGRVRNDVAQQVDKEEARFALNG